MPKITLSNNEIEEVKRLPRKSKLKADYYMYINKWTEKQKKKTCEKLFIKRLFQQKKEPKIPSKNSSSKTYFDY